MSCIPSSFRLDAMRSDISMRNLALLLWILMLVYGAFGDEVTKVGDSATLKSDLTDIKKYRHILWRFDSDLIAEISDGNITYKPGPDGSFRNRLQLDKKTASLTITNMKMKHSGLYNLEAVSSSGTTYKTFTVSVYDELSVMEGDSVTLIINDTRTEKAEELQWTIEGETKIIAKFDREKNMSNYDDKRFKDRLKLDHQMGSLTITNIRNTDSGEYQLTIISSSNIIHDKFNVTVQGEMKTVSVMEGKPIILNTGLIEIQGHDLILWKFEDHLIAEINKETNQFLTHGSSDGGRFNRRQQLNRQSGDLTIRDSRSTDSGVYHLQMNSSSHTVQRTISVTVSESTFDWKTFAIVIICIVVLIIIGIVVGIMKGCINISMPSNRT